MTTAPVVNTEAPAPVISREAAERIRANAVARWAYVDTPAVIRARQRWLAAAYRRHVGGAS